LHGLINRESTNHPGFNASNWIPSLPVATSIEMYWCSSNPNNLPFTKGTLPMLIKSDVVDAKTKAYYEICYDNEKLVDKTEEADPLYEDRYLPRKFKIAIAIPPNNDVDVFERYWIDSDHENNKLLGFNIAIGGGSPLRMAIKIR